MTKRVIVLAVIAIVLLLAVMYLWGPSSVPQGQEPLIALSNTNFSEFENAFDRGSDAPRLVLLLSPT
jgi:hypothetical protein